MTKDEARESARLGYTVGVFGRGRTYEVEQDIYQLLLHDELTESRISVLVPGVIVRSAVIDVLEIERGIAFKIFGK